MGPRSFERGDWSAALWPENPPPPSMGPRSFERGDSFILFSSLFARDAFNGAALFRARRQFGQLRHRGPEQPPSMGPRSFERGDTLDGCSWHPAGATLQWGRALSSAETGPPEPESEPLVNSFNGAALFRARRRAKKGVHDRNADPPSMGPRSFERGDVARLLSAGSRR